MTNESTETELTEDDLRERSEKLSDLQGMYNDIAYVMDPKMPCPECGGGGAVDAGSLGSICVGCMGAKVINQPFYEPMKQPDWKQLRAPITAYFDALADRALPDGHDNKKGLALPPASSVTFDKEMYNELFAQGKAEVKVLATNETAKQLAAKNDDPEDDDEDMKPWT